jgi:hypothetical protein
MARQPKRRGFSWLVDLLEHEVTEAALVCHLGGSSSTAKQVRRANEPGQGRGVSGTEELILPQTNQQRSRLAGYHQDTHLSPHHRQRIGTMAPMQTGQPPAS